MESVRSSRLAQQKHVYSRDSAPTQENHVIHIGFDARYFDTVRRGRSQGQASSTSTALENTCAHRRARARELNQPNRQVEFSAASNPFLQGPASSFTSIAFPRSTASFTLTPDFEPTADFARRPIYETCEC